MRTHPKRWRQCAGLALLLMLGACTSTSQQPHNDPAPNAEGGEADATGQVGAGDKPKAVHKEETMPENGENEGAEQSPAEALQAADKLYYSRDFAGSLPLYQRAAEIAEASDDASVAMEAYAQCARATTLTSKGLDAAQDWLDKAEAAGGAEHPKGWSRLLGVRGVIQRERGETQACIATFSQMYEYCMQHDLHSRAVDATHHLALVAEPEQQIGYALQGIAAAEVGGEATQGWLGPLWNNLGNTYHDLKRYDEALAAFLKAREYHRQGDREMAWMIAEWAVARAYRMVGQIEKSEEMLIETQAWAERLRAGDAGNTAYEFIGMCKHELGEIEATRGNHSAALDLLKQARAIYVEVGYPDHWPEGMAIIDARIQEVQAQAE